MAYFKDHKVAIAMQVNTTGHEMSAFLMELAATILTG